MELISVQLAAEEKLGVKLIPPPPPNEVVEKRGVLIGNLDPKCRVATEFHVRKGDFLVGFDLAGFERIGGFPYARVLELIRDKSKRPLTFLFQQNTTTTTNQQKQPNYDDNLTTYTVVFDEGMLGLLLSDAMTSYGIPGAVVKDLKAQAKDSGLIVVGDIVWKIDDHSVLSLRYEQIRKVIQEAPRPLTVEFVRQEELPELKVIAASYEPSPEMYTPVSSKLQSHPSLSSFTSTMNLLDDIQSTNIRLGGLYKQGRLLKNWKHRHFVLSPVKLEYFDNEQSMILKGEVQFVNQRCTVRELPPRTDIVSKSNPVLAANYLLELCAGDRKLVLACTSSDERKSWSDSLKLAIYASRTANRTSLLRKSISSRDSIFSNASERNHKCPTIEVTVLRTTDLGSSINAVCEVTLGAETFKTCLVKGVRAPMWKNDNHVMFSLEEEDNEGALEVRLFDEKMFRSTELLSCVSIPLESLPNMKEIEKSYPISISNGKKAELVLALTYRDVEKMAQQQKERNRLVDDLARATVMLERDELLHIESQAQSVANQATLVAETAERISKQKQNDALLAAAASSSSHNTDDAMKAVEQAMAEAIEAKNEAEKRAQMARLAEKEAHELIEANRKNFSLQRQPSELTSLTSDFQSYKKYREMLLNKMSQEDVKAKMKADGVADADISAFFEVMDKYELKIKSLQEQVEELSMVQQKQSKDTGNQRDNSKTDISTLVGENSTEQEKFISRLLKVIQDAGITVPEDIPYEKAKAKVKEISIRMQEIGSADVVHEDPVKQKQLREEYFKLEQDMEKYNTAMMVTDEYIEEQRLKEEQWENENKQANEEAVKAIRRMMPVEIKNLSESALETMKTPSGGRISRVIVRKFKRTNILELLRQDPQDILKVHPSNLQNLRVTGLTITERRALHYHLKDIGAKWAAQDKEKMAALKSQWFKTLRATFKSTVNPYNRHVEQYGPPGNHPYASRDNPKDGGCPLIGRQCPLKSNANPAYDEDLGFPDGDIYLVSEVQKRDKNADNVGEIALREAQELIRAKASNARSEELKQHYKGKLVDFTAATGSCSSMDEMLDKIQMKLTAWIEKRMQPESADPKLELAEYGDLTSELRLSVQSYAERSGMKLTGKRNPATDGPDNRSAVEIGLVELVAVAVFDLFDGMIKQMDALKWKDKTVRAAIPDIRSLLEELREKNKVALTKMKKLAPTPHRKLKLIKDIEVEVAAKVASSPSGTASQDSPPSNANDRNLTAGGRSNLMDAIGARGRGPAGGRGGLMDAIAARGRGPAGGRGGLMDAIAARGRGPAGGRGGLMDAIAARGRGPAGGRGGLMDAIAARGRGPAGGRGGLMDAIAARGRGRGNDAVVGGADFLAAIKARREEQ